MSLCTLPYDLLFNIAQYLAIGDIHNLQATCKSLRAFTLTRPVYRALAHGLLARSRPLPLPAFQRLSDLSTRNLIQAVDRAHNFEMAWRVRAPRPARSPSALSGSSSASSDDPSQWYTKISAPPNEEIDWLSPITSSYTLCATKSGRVICWDVARDVCLAEWDPRTLSARSSSIGRSDRPNSNGGGDDIDGDSEETDAEKKWELWKCRVEFDERAVYFTMARVLDGSYDDNRVMEFVLMKLAFPQEVRDYSSPLSQALSFTPESHCHSPSKSPATSPPPSSQESSPQDSILHIPGTAAESAYPTRSPLSTRTLSPLPDHIECYRDVPTDGLCHCATARGPLMGPRGGSRAGILFESQPQPTLDHKPIFFPLTSFHTTGVVMNVFLLDPPRRLLSAFVWVASSNTIGLYVLLDWAKDEYVFVDTGVGCLISSNWSCILHEDQIVIHSEEAEAAYQHFYPLSILRKFVKPRKPSLLAIRVQNYDHGPANYDPPRKFCREGLPIISSRLSPMRSISKKFVFPSVEPTSVNSGSFTDRDVEDDDETSGDVDVEEQPEAGPSTAVILAELPGDYESDTSLYGGSEYGTEDDDDDDDCWSREAVAENSQSKGKGRADDENVVDEDEPGSSSRRAMNKGKMREEDAEPEPNGETSQGRSPSASQQRSPTHSSSSTSTAVQSLVPPSIPSTLSPAPNPYPFPPWYPESAHFVRQWWPTLLGVPRLSCTVVLLAAHDPDTHETRFVLAQHYFRVPIVCEPVPSAPGMPTSDDYTNEDGEDDEMLHLWYVSTPFDVVCVSDPSVVNDDDEETSDRPRPLVAVDFGHAVWIEARRKRGKGERKGLSGASSSARLARHALFSDGEDGEEDDEKGEGHGEEEDEEGEVEEEEEEEEEEENQDQEEIAVASASEDGSVSVSASASIGRSMRRRRSLRRSQNQPRTVSTGSTTDARQGEGTARAPRRQRVVKRLRFVTFPPVYTAVDHHEKRNSSHPNSSSGSGSNSKDRRQGGRTGRGRREEAKVRTLEIPPELDLDRVETINIDQSQGAVILSVKEGKIFILRYE